MFNELVCSVCFSLTLTPHPLGADQVFNSYSLNEVGVRATMDCKLKEQRAVIKSSKVGVFFFFFFFFFFAECPVQPFYDWVSQFRVQRGQNKHEGQA